METPEFCDFLLAGGIEKKILVPIYESMYVILKYLLGALMLLKRKNTNRKCKL